MCSNISKVGSDFSKQASANPRRLHSRPRSTTAAPHVGKSEARKYQRENLGLDLQFSWDEAKTTLMGTHKTLNITYINQIV